MPVQGPEIRRTIQNLSRNLESANETAQENIYTFTQRFVDPCLGSVKSCLYDCTAPCFPRREDNLRRKRGRSRGRAEYNFDFYYDWEDEEAADYSVMNWGNDELDSLLAGRGVTKSGQPRRQRAMSYGSRGRRNPGVDETEQDPTAIPSSSYLGFLERLPFRIGNRALRYQPSAADLQENPGGVRVRDHETEPLIEEDEPPSPGSRRQKGHRRQRSGTVASRASTTTSRSSRGDLIPSDEEEDAVPLTDEFAVMLTRRNTNTEDHSLGKGSSRRPGQSRRSTRTISSKSTPSTKSRRSSSKKSLEAIQPDFVEEPTQIDIDIDTEGPSMVDLKHEEEQIRKEEEMEIEQKREAAHRLAVEKGLKPIDTQDPPHLTDTKEPKVGPTACFHHITRTCILTRAQTPPNEPHPDTDTDTHLTSEHDPFYSTRSSSVVTAIPLRRPSTEPEAEPDSRPGSPVDQTLPQFRPESPPRKEKKKNKSRTYLTDLTKQQT